MGKLIKILIFDKLVSYREINVVCPECKKSQDDIIMDDFPYIICVYKCNSCDRYIKL